MRRTVPSPRVATILLTLVGLVAPPMIENTIGVELSASALANPPPPRTRPSAQQGSNERPVHRVPVQRGDSASSAATSSQDDGQTCSRTFREGAIVRDHRTNVSAACRLALAEHNLGVFRKQLASAPHAVRARVESQLHAAELTLRQAAVDVAREAYDRAKADYASAGPRAKAQAQAKLVQLERELNRKVDDVEVHADKLAADLRKQIEKTAADARTKVADLERQWKSASGKKKEELEAKYIQAERTLERAKTFLAEHDLAQAQRRLDSSLQRVGQQAETAKKRAQDERARAKKTAGDAKKQAEATIAKLEGQLSKLKQSAGKIEDEIDGLKKTAGDLLGSLGF